MLNHRLNPARVTGLAIVLCAAALLPACESSQKKVPPAIANQPKPVAEALRLTELGLDAHEKGEYDKAINYYREALVMNDQISAIWTNLGATLMARQDYFNAGNAFQRAASLDVTDPRPLYNLGLAYERRGHTEEALKHYTSALERSPNDRASLRAYVQLAMRARKDDTVALDRARRLLMVETDPKWINEVSLYKLRLEAAARDRAKRDAQNLVNHSPTPTTTPTHNTPPTLPGASAPQAQPGTSPGGEAAAPR